MSNKDWRAWCCILQWPDPKVPEYHVNVAETTAETTKAKNIISELTAEYDSNRMIKYVTIHSRGGQADEYESRKILVERDRFVWENI
jgi:hypothetical protein